MKITWTKIFRKLYNNLNSKKKQRNCNRNSDKNGKIIVLNYKDYTSLITKALNENYEELPYNEKEILVNMAKLKENISQILVDMWKKNYLDDNLLFLTTGMKKTEKNKDWYFKKSLWPICQIFCYE